MLVAELSPQPSKERIIRFITIFNVLALVFETQSLTFHSSITSQAYSPIQSVPRLVARMIAKRQNAICDDGTYNCYSNNYYSSWDNWVRWVVLAAIIVVFFLVFFACSSRSARRRRRAGQQPFYGTGWSTRPFDHRQGQPYYNNNYPPPPPQYSADMPPGHQGYYGQPSGIELQSPPQSYAPGRSTDVYAPPAGPPPTKGTKDSGVVH